MALEKRRRSEAGMRRICGERTSSALKLLCYSGIHFDPRCSPDEQGSWTCSTIGRPHSTTCSPSAPENTKPSRHLCKTYYIESSVAPLIRLARPTLFSSVRYLLSRSAKQFCTASSSLCSTCSNAKYNELSQHSERGSGTGPCAYLL